MVRGVHKRTDPHLPKVVLAASFNGLGFGLAQRWQQHARKDRNNRDHNEQFDQSEAFSGKASPDTLSMHHGVRIVTDV